MSRVLGLICIAVFCSCKTTNVQTAKVELIERKIENINSTWQYLEDNTAELSSAKANQSWTNLNLPHTWNQWDALDQNPGYRRDASWYKKSLTVAKQADAKYLIYFEGSNITTSVYVNDQLVGKHIGGYVGFEMDITSQLIAGENSIMVRVDNGYNRDIIPSQKADFFIYGGITRDVWLKTVPKTHIQSVKIATPEVTKAVGDATVEANISGECVGCRVKVEVTNQNGKVVGQQVSDASQAIKLSITDPRLWSPSDPYLYGVSVQLMKGAKVVDRSEERIGFRWYEFEDNGAFFLNGERLLLRGTHRHEEHAGYGAAMPNNLHRKDMEMIKGVGANFLRLGHYPQDPEVYKACDELGIIVWDELPWCRGGVGGKVWQQNTKRLLKEQINQNINHPSIFFWSVGNEIYWLPDFENGGDKAALKSTVKELHDICHQIDPYRMTSIRKYYDGADLVDVFSPSIWSGWYAGVYTNYEKTLIENQKKYPRFLHMEYGGSSHIGRHTETPVTGVGTLNDDDWEEVSNQVNIQNIAKEGDWTENYIVDLFDWYLGVTERKDDFAGNAQWAFKDFGTPLRPENAIPYMNQKGLVDRDGNPKDAYYVYKSYWSDEPMVYIESHTWTERTGPKDKSREVSVYSNCGEVELFLNGKSLGKKSRDINVFPACGLTWDVTFTEGENNLEAKGVSVGKSQVSDNMTVNYSYDKADKPERVHLSHSKLENGNYLIEAVMVDKAGRRVLDYEGRMYFALDGSGELLVDYGTPTRSQVIEMANGRAAIEMKPGKGKGVVEARNQDFKGSYLTIDFENPTAKKQ